tara:strand:- start:2798 stop:3751 length:954 start_codon:yes stop_codon:yes gene_type:complete
MNSSLITIGIATFNASGTIESSIKAALSQTWRPIEIVIVDDCSKDDTFEKLIKMSKMHKEIRIFKNKKNYGIGFVRNLIIKETRGEFLAFFDDDDESIKERLEMQHERIIEYEKHICKPSLIICHSSRKVIYPSGKMRIEKTLGSNINFPNPSGSSVAKRILLGKPLKDGYGACPTCCQMARISTYQTVNGFDSKFRRSEDTEFCIRLALNGAHFVGIKKPLVLQRMTKTFDKNLDIEFKYANMILKKHKIFINKNGNYEFCLEWQKTKYIFYKREFYKFLKLFFILIIKYPKETLIRFFQSLRTININLDYSLFHK